MVSKALLVTDSTAARLGIEALIARVDELDILEFVDHVEAVSDHQGRQGEPSLVVLDGGIGMEASIETCRRIVQQWPQVPVLILATTSQGEVVRAAINAGARGYLLKDVPPETLIAGIGWLVGGEAVLDPRVTSHVITWAISRACIHADSLTIREVEALRYASEGEPNKRIARMMGISENSVKTYLKRAYKKLDCHSRSAAVAALVRNGRL